MSAETTDASDEGCGGLHTPKSEQQIDESTRMIQMERLSQKPLRRAWFCLALLYIGSVGMLMGVAVAALRLSGRINAVVTLASLKEAGGLGVAAFSPPSRATAAMGGPAKPSKPPPIGHIDKPID
eukprot:GHVU01103943.1.p1 GENE.GHVU01103943.1~~GHVU01103943.1.p1  ORF type:complete len:125 (+),score=24.99 GHVU01103943.1:164-538(+)